MDFHKLGDVHLWLLDDLDLLDVNWIQRVDAFAGSLDFGFDLVHEAALNEAGQRLGSNFSLKDLDDFLTDLLDLCGLSISEHRHLVILNVLSESNDENTNDVTVSGLAISLCFDEGMTLLDHLAHLVTSQGETVEVGEAVTSLDFLDLELDLLVSIFGLVKVSDVEFADTSLKTIGLDLLTLSLGDASTSDLGTSSLEVTWSLDVVPDLSQESIGLFLLLTLLASLGKTFVLTICHVVDWGKD